eukprot:5419768-Prymnesium_polylepis.1
MREAAPSPRPTPPTACAEGTQQSPSKNRSMEAWLCDPKPFEGLPRLPASAERSRVHRCARR